MAHVSFYSTNGQAPEVDFKTALMVGQAPDRGLYNPNPIPKIPKEELESFTNKSYDQIAFDVARHFLQNQVPEKKLRQITREVYTWEIPLEQVTEKEYVMRLDRGPTASFKDFAAQMMGQLMQYFLEEENRNCLILTATSGDTGSAVANAFYDLPNVDVVVLYPEKEVTDRQRKQMTTLGKNISAIGVDGKFDDCQAMVKQCFADKELESYNLSSANSINYGRILPQLFYYFYAWSRITPGDRIIFSVPSGNFGDMMGATIAREMGLPVEKLVIATNENDEFVRFMDTGAYQKIVPSRNCISNAMNVGHPSNLARLVNIYGGYMDHNGVLHKQPDMIKMWGDMQPESITDELTKHIIRKAYEEHELLLEPHGAVGWAGLLLYRLYGIPSDKIAVSLETAHPSKFPEHIKALLEIDPELSGALKGLDQKKEFLDSMEATPEALKKYIKKNF